VQVLVERRVAPVQENDSITGLRAYYAAARTAEDEIVDCEKTKLTTQLARRSSRRVHAE